MAEELPIVADKEPMDPGESPAAPTRPAEGIREHGIADHARVTALASVLGVAIQRVEIADAVAEVAQRVLGGVLQIRAFGTKDGPDHLSSVFDGLIGDA